jgi:putative N6-adenine-specific DNA methylase
MCGSGTLAIEAALIAAGIPPGIFRERFGFETWKDFDRELLENVAHQLAPEREVKVPVLARDVDPEAVKLTREQVKRMDISRYVSVEQMDFLDSPEMEDATLIMNPPYGERMKPADLESLYAGIGSTLKHKFPGSDAWILSSNMDAIKRIGLKASSRIRLYNGSLECHYMNYKTFKGNWKEYKKNVTF